MSFVTTLVTDTRTVDNPSWDDVERAILLLDAQTVTEVMLAPPPPKGPPDGDHHMGIGGGGNGLCVVYMTEDNLHFWNLEDPVHKDGTKPKKMLIGGQEGDFCGSQLVPREWAMRAARGYYERGERAADLSWVAA
jgi:hypothetical protein